MCYTGFYADIVAGKKTKEVIDMYEDSDDYCPMEELESLEFCVVVSDADTYDEISTSDPIDNNFANNRVLLDNANVGRYQDRESVSLSSVISVKNN